MADEQEHPQSSSRFRLPRLFSHAPEVVHEVIPDVEMISDDMATPQSKDGGGSMVVGPFVAGSLVEALTANRSKNAAPKPPAGKSSTDARTSDSSTGDAHSTSLNALASQAVVTELSALRSTVEDLSDQITQVNNRETSLEKVFDTLHKELAGYKNDFLYEHLKPVVRPLLFLFDSLEQFDGEVALAEASLSGTAPVSHELLTPGVVRENVQFFRDQLAEALQVCEVTIMEPPSGAFNAKLHRAVDVVPVAFEDDGSIVRVIRSGWFLNGQLLRPAEVVVGKHRG